ncbi:MAG: hypothetical protein GXZ15_06625 [Campylobacter sp.]|nr:hypothetical protein [Campylobacter sp.]
MRRFSVFLIILMIAGCSTTQPTPPKALNFTMISSNFKISDAGFLRTYKNSTQLQVYSSGTGLLEVKIKDRVCYNSVCKDELEFNNDFFKRVHYRGFFENILKKEPIYEKRNLVKTECGFDQNLTDISYQICGEKMTFVDSRNGIKIIIREVN